MTSDTPPNGVDVGRSASEWAGAASMRRFFAFQPSQPVDGLREMVKQAIAEVNAGFDSEVVSGDVIVQVNERIFVRVTGRGPARERKRWLQDLADALTTAGLHGRFVKPQQRFAPTEVLELMQGARPVTAFLAYQTPDADGKRVREVFERFGADARVAHVVADQAGFEMPFSPAVAKFVTELHNSISSVTLLGGGGLSYVIWNGSCTQLTAHRVMPGKWADHVADAARLIADHADNLTYAMVRRATHHSTWTSVTADEPLPPDPRHAGVWQSGPQSLPDRVVDVCGVQLLTAARLGAAANLDAWEVHEVARDRFLVKASDLAPWFAGPRVADSTLTQARRDFGSMIATVEELEAAEVAYRERRSRANR